MEFQERPPKIGVEEKVQMFEESASAIYQANAAMVVLNELKKYSDSITKDQQQRLLSACDRGMEINPKNSKEFEQFQDFKGQFENLFKND